jgi:hypothetical protein
VIGLVRFDHDEPSFPQGSLFNRPATHLVATGPVSGEAPDVMALPARPRSAVLNAGLA